MESLKKETEENIIHLCKKYGVSKVILFGSRARNDYRDTSDIDLAISGATDFNRLYAELKYNEFTLLDVDVINLDEKISNELQKEIEHDGCVLYQEER